nr:hypothetical protein BaRGS_015054 [Batillaria attramentaria]
MFVNQTRLSTFGGKAIAVPGELKGLWYLHQHFGRVPWADLIQPTIDLCVNGAELTAAQQRAAVQRKDDIINNTEFSFLFDDNGEVKPAGSIIHRPKLGEVLKAIAADGADAFYDGCLTDDIVADIQDADGMITRDDLVNYQVEVTDPVTFEMTSPPLTVYSMPPPGSGVVLEYILNILSGYNFTPASVATPTDSILTHHRIVEAMKFAYAKRTELGDARFLNISELIYNMTSPEFGEEIRGLIDDTQTHNLSYYGPTFYDAVKTSTAHFSLMDGEGNVVSVTSTVNTYFGSKVKGNRTGIVFNNEMDDFSTPGTVNYFGVPASEANFIQPGKRPLSSMTPSVFVDRDTGDVKLVAGAAGGTKITTATAKVAIDTLWFNKTVVEAVDAPRMHHQLLPPELQLEDGFPENKRIM